MKKVKIIISAVVIIATVFVGQAFANSSDLNKSIYNNLGSSKVTFIDEYNHLLIEPRSSEFSEEDVINMISELQHNKKFNSFYRIDVHIKDKYLDSFIISDVDYSDIQGSNITRYRN